MTDAEYVLKETNRDRAVVRRSARYKKNGSRSRSVSLPSDSLTPAQWRRKNGGVSVYNLNAPTTYRVLCSWPEDVQREYLTRLISRFNATGNSLSKMLGVSGTWVNKHLRTLGIDNAKHRRMSGGEMLAFDNWLNSTGPDTDAPVEEAVVTAPETEEPTTHSPTALTPSCPPILAGSLTLAGKPLVILDRMHYLFADCGEDYTITITWERR